MLVHRSQPVPSLAWRQADFNEAFVDLQRSANMGTPRDPKAITDAERIAFRRFFNTIQHPPHPDQVVTGRLCVALFRVRRDSEMHARERTLHDDFKTTVAQFTGGAGSRTISSACTTQVARRVLLRTGRS